MMIGKRISGRYKILDMVGGGGMANVYLAHDMILDRDVAVKMLRLDYVNDDEFVRRFHREAQSATSLTHPNIVSIYDVGEEDTIYYIVMEYVNGYTLKQYIQKHSPVPVETAIEIMKQLTSAISHAHQNNIVHRDIKPHNILVDKQGNVKITDFGIAMALSATSITQTNSVLGSVHYLSPEQARGGMANKKSDIYSLGIVMFELLTGRLPFSGESAVSIALKHLQSETPSIRRWNEEIPQSVENIVLKATAKDPFHRYSSVEEMGEDLQTALNPERKNEPKFVSPIDVEATKAIPIITNDRPYPNLDETIIHGKEDTKQVNKQEAPKNKKQDTKKPKKKSKKVIVLLVSVFLFLLLAGVFAVTVLPDLLIPEDVAIPDVSGEEMDEAIASLELAGFVIGETVPLNDEKVKEGAVIRTSPKAGRKVKKGQEIDIYQSLGKEKYELDNYIGQQYEDVVNQLEKEGFKKINKVEQFDENQPSGTILSQNLSKGEEVVPEDADIEFTISKGAEYVRLSDLTGYTKKEVNDYVNSAGLSVDFKEEYSDTVDEGKVVSHSPEAGLNVRKGSRISIVISKGAETIPTKEVTEEITIPYEPAEEGKPQEVIIFVQDLDHNMTEPYDTFTINETTKKTITLRVSKDDKAGYKVMRDTNVILDQVVPYPD
ncbi:Stk1 family PASTA domain-containing Ser/Thr kinase [Niallia sp. 03133]|uniref:Stk1 family PASTA domain-containing Ser/Thr kinase n=1 Tax=Niallia sp. 03133 TaxID=3458060 RepID=UPI004043F846